MKLLRNLAVAYLIALAFTPSFARKKTIAGCYISLQGDTVKGAFPNYSQWSKNPSEVKFTIASSAKLITLTPQSCQKFVIEGYEEYISYSGQRLVNPITDYEVLDTRYSTVADDQEKVVTFLRLVTRTPNSELYVFSDSKRTNFFYRLPGSSIVELKYKKNYYIHNVADADLYEYQLGNIITTSEYKDQLKMLFAYIIEKRRLSTTLEKLAYTEDELENFFEQLFPADWVKHKQKNYSAGWIVSAGASLNSMNVKAAKSMNIVAKEYNSSISPLLSIGYLVPSSRNFGKYFLYQQLNLFRYKNTGEINDGTFKRVTTYQSDLISADVNVGVNFVNLHTFRLYLSGGAGMTALLNNKRQDLKYLNNSPSTEPYRFEQTSIPSKATSLINASAGMVITNKFFIGVTYLLPTQIDNVLNYTPRYSALQLRISYKVK